MYACRCKITVGIAHAKAAAVFGNTKKRISSKGLGLESGCFSRSLATPCVFETGLGVTANLGGHGPRCMLRLQQGCLIDVWLATQVPYLDYRISKSGK